MISGQRKQAVCKQVRVSGRVTKLFGTSIILKKHRFPKFSLMLNQEYIEKTWRSLCICHCHQGKDSTQCFMKKLNNYLMNYLTSDEHLPNTKGTTITFPTPDCSSEKNFKGI